MFCCCRKESAKRRRMIPSACPASTSRWESESLLSAPECISTINFNPSAWLGLSSQTAWIMQAEDNPAMPQTGWGNNCERVYKQCVSCCAVIVINSGFSSAHHRSIYTMFLCCRSRSKVPLLGYLKGRAEKAEILPQMCRRTVWSTRRDLTKQTLCSWI